MIEQADLFRTHAVQLARQHHEKFSDEFMDWLPKNLHVYGAFCKEALSVRQRGFTHYSSRTIVEFLRHHTAIKENPAPGAGWKINDHNVPYLGRLFDLEHPKSAGLFEYRRTKKAYTAPADIA